MSFKGDFFFQQTKTTPFSSLKHCRELRSCCFVFLLPPRSGKQFSCMSEYDACVSVRSTPHAKHHLDSLLVFFPTFLLVRLCTSFQNKNKKTISLECGWWIVHLSQEPCRATPAATAVLLVFLVIVFVAARRSQIKVLLLQGTPRRPSHRHQCRPPFVDVVFFVTYFMMKILPTTATPAAPPPKHAILFTG